MSLASIDEPVPVPRLLRAVPTEPPYGNDEPPAYAALLPLQVRSPRDPGATATATAAPAPARGVGAPSTDTDPDADTGPDARTPDMVSWIM